MNRYRVSASANGDLEDIWTYIAEKNPEAADHLIRAIVKKFHSLAEMPDLGRARLELSPGLRSVPVGNYIVFYRNLNDGVEIVRVLHGARDYPPLFE